MNCRTYKKTELMWNLTMGLALVGALILSGCSVEVVDQEKKPAAPQMQNQAEEPEYNLEGLPEPNQYRILFREDLRSEVIMTSSEILEGGKTYEFQTRTRRLLKVQVPRDLVFGELNFPKDPKRLEKWEIKTDGRVFLLRPALLITMGNDLTIEATEIVSRGATIQTFDANAEAEKGMPGRNGGFIQIKARKASGALKIEMRGEKGGRGEDAYSYPGRAQAGKATGNPYSACAAANGTDGSPGHDGYRGGPGSKGGDTGNLQIEIQETSDLKLEIEFFKGFGGDGGRGGEGQLGGQGGEGVCGGVDGRPGPNGHQGVTGMPGQPGQKGLYCYLRNDQTKCD